MSALFPELTLVSDSPAVQAALAVCVAVFVCLHIYRDFRKELDIQSGMEEKTVRQYYRKLFHKKAEKQDYRERKLQCLGLSGTEALSWKELLVRQAKAASERQKERTSLRRYAGYDNSEEEKV